MPSRRTFLKTSAAVATVGVAGVATDAVAFEANDPHLVRIQIPVTRLPEEWDGLRIVQLSDFHYDPYFSAVPIRRAVKVVNDLQPDLIVLTGDFVTKPFFRGHSLPGQGIPVLAIEPCSELLRGLRSRLGSVAVLGNHDVACGPERIVATLGRKGIPVLRNGSIPLEQNGKRLWVAGVDDVLQGKPDLAKALLGIPKDEPVILLSHEPDFVDEARRYPVDLQLSGHSHGGQIRFPFVGALYLPDLAHKYPMGRYNFGPLTLYTNVGIGTIMIPARLNCPPEITLITLRSKASL